MDEDDGSDVYMEDSDNDSYDYDDVEEAPSAPKVRGGAQWLLRTRRSALGAMALHAAQHISNFRDYPDVSGEPLRLLGALQSAGQGGYRGAEEAGAERGYRRSQH